MNRIFLAVAAAVVLVGCAHGRIDWYGYGSKWQNTGLPPPACAEELHAVTRAKAPCPAGDPKHGYVHWLAEPFMCDGRKVWGCSDAGSPWVAAHVALPPSGHASDSAQAEEIAHWIWPKCFPGVRTEWQELDPVTGKVIFKRDPAFEAWFWDVRKTTRASCPAPVLP